MAGYAAPVEGGYLTDVFGMRYHPVYQYWVLHSGIDIVRETGTCGTPIHAATSGVVSFAGSTTVGYGNYIVIDIGGGNQNGYGHIMDGGIAVSVGQHVNAGDVIGYIGTTGASTGCHLHFEVMAGGEFIDPLPWLNYVGVYYS